MSINGGSKPPPYEHLFLPFPIFYLIKFSYLTAPYNGAFIVEPHCVSNNRLILILFDTP